MEEGTNQVLFLSLSLSLKFTFFCLRRKMCLCVWSELSMKYHNWCGPGSSVGTATELRAGCSGDRIPVRTRFSAPVKTGPGAHPASCTTGTGSFPGVKSGRGVTLTPSHRSSAVVKKEYSYTSAPSMGRTARTEPQCLCKGALYLLPYLFLLEMLSLYPSSTLHSIRLVQFF